MNKAVSSTEKALTFTKVHEDGGDKTSSISMVSIEPQVKSRKQKASQHVQVAISISSQSEERENARTEPSTNTSTLVGKVTASSIESSKLKSSLKRETNKNDLPIDNSSTATSKMNTKKGTKVSEIKSMFESVSHDAKKSNRTMGSPSRNESVAKSLAGSSAPEYRPSLKAK